MLLVYTKLKTRNCMWSDRTCTWITISGTRVSMTRSMHFVGNKSVRVWPQVLPWTTESIRISIPCVYRVKFKMPCYDYDQDRSVGFCCHSTLGYVQTVRPIHRPNGLGIVTSWPHVPKYIVTTKSPRTSLNPLYCLLFHTLDTCF